MSMECDLIWLDRFPDRDALWEAAKPAIAHQLQTGEWEFHSTPPMDPSLFAELMP